MRRLPLVLELGSSQGSLPRDSVLQMQLVTFAAGTAASAVNLQGIRSWCILEYPLTSHCVPLHPLTEPHLDLGKDYGGLSFSFPPCEEGFQASPLANKLTEGEAVSRTKKPRFLHNLPLINSVLLATIMYRLQINLPWFQLWTFSVPAKLPSAGGTSEAVTNSLDPRHPFYNGLVLNQTAALS